MNRQTTTPLNNSSHLRRVGHDGFHTGTSRLSITRHQNEADGQDRHGKGMDTIGGNHSGCEKSHQSSKLDVEANVAPALAALTALSCYGGEGAAMTHSTTSMASAAPSSGRSEIHRFMTGILASHCNNKNNATVNRKHHEEDNSRNVAIPTRNHAEKSAEQHPPTPQPRKAVAALKKDSNIEDEKKKSSSSPDDGPTYAYRDFARYSRLPVSSPTSSSSSGSSVGVTPQQQQPNFPEKLYDILSRPEVSDIITWMPHGRSWIILRPKKFESMVLPLLYSSRCKYSSFIRQANGWGFRRISQGRDLNSYYHELFLRGMPHLTRLMRRPGIAKKLPADSENEPDFYKLDKISPLPPLPTDPEKEVGQVATIDTNSSGEHHHATPPTLSQPVLGADQQAAVQVEIVRLRQAQALREALIQNARDSAVANAVMSSASQAQQQPAFLHATNNPNPMAYLEAAAHRQQQLLLAAGRTPVGGGMLAPNNRISHQDFAFNNRQNACQHLSLPGPGSLGGILPTSSPTAAAAAARGTSLPPVPTANTTSWSNLHGAAAGAGATFGDGAQQQQQQRPYAVSLPPMHSNSNNNADVSSPANNAAIASLGQAILFAQQQAAAAGGGGGGNVAGMAAAGAGMNRAAGVRRVSYEGLPPAMISAMSSLHELDRQMDANAARDRARHP